MAAAAVETNHIQVNDLVEGVVCNETDLNDNEMKTFDLADAGKVLIVKQHGTWSALGTKCTHYGAPMVNGALGDGRVRCPWHGACFNLSNGDIEDFPGMDSLPCYQVKVEDGKVKVKARKRDLESNKRVKEMAKRDESNQQTFVIVGGGPSGATCVETLRQEGFTGRIIFVNKEPNLPYDRVKVTKAMNLNAEKLKLRSQAFYNDTSIETLLGVEAVGVNSDQREVSLSNGTTLKYDKLFIATGSKARKLPVPGSDLKNVVVVRTVADSQYIESQLDANKKVVVLGVSFIGLEAAAYCVDKVKELTVIGRDNAPLKPVFGDVIGARIQRLCESKGVKFKMNNGINACNGDADGKLVSVELNDGEVLEADLCIMGVGSSFYTDFLKGSNINLNPNGSIDTNLYLQSNIFDIYIGGDIANAPVYSSNNEKAAIGHYGLAQYHGRIAALNMLGKKTELKAVPFFWAMLFGTGIKYSGHGRFKNVHIVGDVEKFDFAAYYLDEHDEVIAMASAGMSSGSVVPSYAEYRTQGQKLFKTDLQPEPFAFMSRLNKVN